MPYKNLQACIWSSTDELVRFRQLIVNMVMATDIFDPNLKKTRNARWDKIFLSDMENSVEGAEFRNLKASIVIEHIVSFGINILWTLVMETIPCVLTLAILFTRSSTYRSKQLTFLTRCNIGIRTRNGTRDCSRRWLSPTRKAEELQSIHQKDGMQVSQFAIYCSIVCV
jgi:hypothetical protein